MLTEKPGLIEAVRARFAHVDTCPFEGPRVFFENAGGALTLTPWSLAAGPVEPRGMPLPSALASPAVGRALPSALARFRRSGPSSQVWPARFAIFLPQFLIYEYSTVALPVLYCTLPGTRYPVYTVPTPEQSCYAESCIAVEP